MKAGLMISGLLESLSIFLVFSSLVVGSSCIEVGGTCPGSTIDKGVWPEDARLIAEEPNGKLLEVGLAEDPLKVLHVYGSPYELGRAHGALLKNEVQSMYKNFFSYMEDQVIHALRLGYLPQIITRPLARLLVNAALDMTFLLTWRYTPARFVDEMMGLASGAEVEYRDVLRIQMIPELLQASCSMLGAWGPATSGEPSQGGLYQMRALDWDMNAPILDFHTVVFYHPSEGNSFAIFTWAGFLGCVTCYSGHLGISEKVWLGYSGSSSRRGTPWHFLLRDIVQFSKDIEQAQLLLNAAQRTCPILVGIGSSKDSRFFLLGYAADALTLYDDSNFTVVTSLNPGEDQAVGVVFVDKYVQPSDDNCMGSLVRHNYGALNANALMEMVSIQQTGDMHAAVYDFSGNNVYFSWAVKDLTTGRVVPAYKRQFVKLNMSSLLPPGLPCHQQTDSCFA